MRILMISDVYFPRINGVSTSIKIFSDELKKLGHQVTLIAPAYDKTEELVFDEAQQILRVPSRVVMFDHEDRLVRGEFLPELLEWATRRDFDICHIQTPFLAHRLGLKIARHLNIPVIETYHTFFEEYFYHYIPFLPKALLRYAARRLTSAQCNRLDAVIAPSTAMSDKLKTYGVAVPVNVIPTGIELNKFTGGDGVSFRKRHGIALSRPVMVHIGRVAFEKNIDFLLQVVAVLRTIIPDVLLVIAGEGPARQRLERLSRRLGISDNVKFIGYLDRETELLDCYRAGDVFVFASRTETQGLVLLEAMALATPVVSIAEMGTRDILIGARGAIIAENDVSDFAIKVQGVLLDRPRRNRLAEEAKNYAHQWRAEAFAMEMRDCYLRISQSIMLGAVA